MQHEKLIPLESRAEATAAFMMDNPFEFALTRIRRAIRAGQLCIAAEIDAAQRVDRALQIYVPPCRLLLVDNPLCMLEATAIDRASSLFIPLHLVVSGGGNRTLLTMLNPEHIRQSELPIGIRAPVLDLQRQLIRALSGIANRLRHPPGQNVRSEVPDSVEAS